MARGEDINAVTKSGETLLAKAILSGSRKVIEIVLDSGVAINFVANERKKSHLIQALEQGDMEIAELLIARGAEVTCADFSGKTSLHEAVNRNGGLIGIAMQLLEKGANVNACTHTGQTPLHWAAWTGDKDMVQLLL